ncbi:hypothetical protein HZH68_006264 [Vespula germanica]|uniref:Uncharacterized protein n=1 Tax=Vespula germanica TaxID=30212 RepID=A0A834NB43_VESGE|nr:hypothetical protein HZH68_006264 [Vespula germanica]
MGTRIGSRTYSRRATYGFGGIGKPETGEEQQLKQEIRNLEECLKREKGWKISRRNTDELARSKVIYTSALRFNGATGGCLRACLWGRRMVHPRPSHGPGNAGSSSNQGLRLTEP